MQALCNMIEITKDDPVLVEVSPSVGNIALPFEFTEDWEALIDGGFQKVSLLEQRRTARMAENALHIAALGLASFPIQKNKKAFHKSKRNLKSKTPSVCPPASRRKDVIPVKKDRSEKHPFLGRRVAVIWSELAGPEIFYGVVSKYDSDRKGAPFLVEYDDGEKQWEKDVEPIV